MLADIDNMFPPLETDPAPAPIFTSSFDAVRPSGVSVSDGTAVTFTRTPVPLERPGAADSCTHMVE